jgi:hypothetical protein
VSPVISGLLGSLQSAPTRGYVVARHGRVDVFALDHADYAERLTFQGRHAQPSDGIAGRARAGNRNPGR